MFITEVRIMRGIEVEISQKVFFCQNNKNTKYSVMCVLLFLNIFSGFYTVCWTKKAILKTLMRIIDYFLTFNRQTNDRLNKIKVFWTEGDSEIIITFCRNFKPTHLLR